MMLWDIIRDFFVQYIFGGHTSAGAYDRVGCLVGYFDTPARDDIFEGFTDDVYIQVGSTWNVGYSAEANYLCLGDWLSTTATIITLCAICVFLFFFVRWLFRLTAGLVSGRG